MIRRWFRRLAVIQGLFALAMLTYLAAAAAGGLLSNGAPVPPPGEDTYRIGLFQGSLHTDLLIPVTPDVRARFAFVQDAGVPVLDPQAEWLLVGWGASSFFATVGSVSDITAHTLWRSATGDSSVLRIDVAGRIEDFSRITLMALTPDQFNALTDAILDSFARMADGGRIPLPYAGFTPTDGFFAGRDRFHMARTCNVWVSEMFARAGLRFGRWTPTNYAVRLAFWRFVPQN
ncbi:MAG: TIGR02117 family protein [Rhodobacterales bacterium]|jgi:uncharacterized protein (TIGR02117 family)